MSAWADVHFAVTALFYCQYHTSDRHDTLVNDDNDDTAEEKDVIDNDEEENGIRIQRSIIINNCKIYTRLKIKTLKAQKDKSIDNGRRCGVTPTGGRRVERDRDRESERQDAKGGVSLIIQIIFAISRFHQDIIHVYNSCAFGSRKRVSAESRLSSMRHSHD